MNAFAAVENPTLLLVDDDEEFLSVLAPAMHKRGWGGCQAQKYHRE
mgnify:CR=1 FL=1